MLTKFCDVNIHASCIEVVIINPDGLKGKITLQNLVGIDTKKLKKFGFLGSKFNHITGLFIDQLLLLSIELVFSKLINFLCNI